MLNGEHFQLPSSANFAAAQLSDDGHNHWFFNLCGSAQFTCHDMVVITNQHINLVSVPR
jgi:hypothetical protein